MDLGVLNVLTEAGGGWVIFLLTLASVGVVAVIVERWIVLRRERRALAATAAAVGPLLSEGKTADALRVVGGAAGAAARMLAAGFARSGSIAAAEERLVAARLMEKKSLEKNLLILGTLGSNAPFIGLFGTVLGVIKAFRDLALSASAGPEVVMSGLAEALIATAVGLLVAIPAVIGYNMFQKIVADLLAETDAVSRLWMAALKDHGRD
jgi:biopolymer transport protein ExbB/TolQ